MTHLVNHPARLRRVPQFHRVADAAQPQAAHDGFLVFFEPDRALQKRHLHGAAGFVIGSMIRHGSSPYAFGAYADAPVSSASSLPRIRARNEGSFSPSSPAIVARTT